MTRDQVKTLASGVYRLASQCRVPMLRACRRINMATSTPHRWVRKGSEPGPGQLEALRASILRIAAEAGTLPAKHLAEFEKLGPEERPRTVREIARDLGRIASELNDSLAASES
jgi:hypothetical protein